MSDIAKQVFQITFSDRRHNRVHQFDKPQEWLLNPQDYGPFPLENGCYLLDPTRLRISLRRWQAMKHLRRWQEQASSVAKRSTGSKARAAEY
jgi:hypothetical protein